MKSPLYLLLTSIFLLAACSAPKPARETSGQTTPAQANREKVASAMNKGEIPSFPGGLDALMRYLSKNVRYPKAAYDNGIDGTVLVQFMVQEDGSITSPEIISQYRGGGLEQEAVRVVEQMPRWEPGHKDGKPISAIYKLPIRFTLPPHKKSS